MTTPYGGSATALSMQEIEKLDMQIQQLLDCKPLPENDVKALCDKVNLSP